jgi:hypothetical protein
LARRSITNMPNPTLLFIHGTGVRSESYAQTLKQIEAKVAEFHLPCTVASCPWGDVYGIDFDGLSLPEPPVRDADEEAQAYRWEYLQIDPLFDLRLWCTPAAEPPRKIVGETPAAQILWGATISKYIDASNQHIALKELLERNQIEPFFAPAWNKVVATGLPKQAFAAAGNESPDVSRVFAEAVVAQMMHDAAQSQPPVPISPRTGYKIITILLFDWKQAAKGLKDLFRTFFGAATKTIVRPLRAGASRAIAPAIGDILLYQAVGESIRGLIQKEIESIPGEIFVLAHSLGGIACFELMVEQRCQGADRLMSVKGLITAGSQATLLYELGALQTLSKGTPLPAAFPKWLNLYDENDLLSYRANRLFAIQPDRQVDSMLPPLEAHSAYWKLDETWNAIGEMMK